MAQDDLPWPSVTQSYHRDTYPAINPTKPALSTKGKNIVITGAGQGIGAEMAKAFARSGASTIALLGRTEKTLLQTKDEIEQFTRETKVSTYVADISDAASLERAFTTQAKNAGAVDVIVANAGFLPKIASIADTTLDDWYAAFDINVKGNFNLVRAFLPHAAEDAAVINTSTGIAHLPYVEGTSGYHLSKLAAAKLFDYVHMEHPKLFVLNFHPGVIRTAMNEKHGASGTVFPYDDVQLPAAFAVWAASPEARFLNGKFVWCHWDVDELKSMAKEIEDSDRFTLGLHGWY